MLEVLGETLDVRFEERTLDDDAGIDAWILPEADREILNRIVHCTRPCYAVVHNDLLVPCGESSAIDFGLDSAVPSVLGGRQIRCDEAVNVTALPRWLKDVTVLASKEASPVWAMQEVGGRQHHYVALPIPELSDDESLFLFFHRNRFLQLLPLILFLRTLIEEHGWEQPPLRACFMFDDPNLHWQTYGFVDFAQIAAHAQMHNYKVSFATIPLDTWFTHKPTALLFQRYRDQLSLLIHGNNHIAEELARPYVDEDLNRNLRQALRRIDDFERRSGVEVSKVMAPPHGACSESALRVMAHLGFEAACISKGSLSHYNRQASWLHTFGMQPGEIIGGLPIIPRFPLSGNCHNNILVAALLHQPIIPVGHHHDIADGLQLLADLSGFVNSLGKVRWANMQDISRSNYARRLEGEIIRVRMFTKRIEVCIPEGINQILVERPWLKGVDSLPVAWKPISDGSEWSLHLPGDPIHVLSCQKIEIVAEQPRLSVIDATSIRNFHVWPVVRRQLTEARDRLAPVLRRISTVQIKSNQT